MRRALVASWVAMIAIAVTVNIPPPCLTSIEKSFGLTKATGGIMLSSVFWGFAFTLAAAGPIADRIGMRPLLALASVLQIAGLLTCAFSPCFAVLVLGAVLMGMGSGILEVLVNPIVCLIAPDKKTRAVNFCHAFYAIGAALSILITSLLMEKGMSWRRVYMFGTLLPALHGVMYQLSPLPVLPTTERKGMSVRDLLRQPVFLLFVACMFFAGGTELGPVQWIPAYVEQTIRASKTSAAVVFVLFYAGMALGRLSMSRLSSRFRPLVVLRAAAGCCALLLVLSGFLSGSRSAAVTFFLLGFFVSVFWPTILALSTEAFPTAGATLFSLLGISGNAGGMVFPASVGIVADKWHLRGGMGMLAVLPLLLLVLFTAVQKRDGQGTCTTDSPI